jgi:hypothetical protein
MEGKNIFIIALLFLLSSCATAPLDLSLDFQVPAANSVQPIKGVLGVDEFIDLRERISTGDDKKWMGFVPGVLWLNIISETPDTYTGFSAYNSGPFTRAFALAVFKGMEQSGVFEKTVFLLRDKYAPINYRLEGVLNRTLLKETGYYYGSGFYAWLTRIIGLPYVSYEFSLDITLKLRRMDTNEIVWVYELKGEGVDKFNTVYRLTSGKEGRHVLSYDFSKILKEKMPSAMESMRKALNLKKS